MSTEAIHSSIETTAMDSHAHDKPSYDDVNTPVIVLVGAISAVVALLIIMFVQGLYYQWSNQYLDARQRDVVNTPAAEQVAAQKSLLQGGDEIVPIDKAMESVVKKYGN